MKSKQIRNWALLVCLVFAIFVCMGIAHSIQTDGGNIRVSFGTLDTEAGELTYKLYVPATATAETPAPGVLLLHGYQNDHETCAAYSIELARRGVVVMALDEYGHGGSEAGLLNRGYVNHRVKVTFGEDSVEDGTFVSVGGAKRYRLMMNFSNLSFFHDRYTKDADGNVLTDSSCGGIAAYAALADMDFVDPGRLGLSGHSMGTWSSWSVAAAYSGAVNTDGVDISPKATVLQCGELFRESAYNADTIHFNNVLLLQAKYDEFSYFRDYRNFVNDDVLHSDLRAEFLGCDKASCAWDTTYGDFADGTARRMELLETNHRLATHDSAGMAVALQWFDSALSQNPSPLPSTDQVYMTKEVLVFTAMLLAIAAMLPLMELLLELPFFRGAAVPLPSRGGILTGRRWWKNAAITMFLSGASYPFMTQLGHGLLPLPEGIFRMTIGNGFVSWYLLLILIMLFTTWMTLRKAKKAGTAPWHDLGLAGPEGKRLDWGLLGKGLALSGCMVGFMYVLVTLSKAFFLLDFRFIWPFFKPFTLARFGQFLVYFPIFAVFFLLGGSKIFAGMRSRGTYESGPRGFLSCWWRYALLMIGGVLFIVLIEYIPFFMGIGPGADLLFGSTFGGPFMSILIVFVPQVVVFSVLCTYCYRRTGNAYTGAFTVAAMAAWIITGGSAML